VPSSAVGDLSISSSPQGATIFIDGYNEGLTPATFSNIRTGSHAITLQLAGYQDYQTSVMVTTGHT
jgi:hypothetical protein